MFTSVFWDGTLCRPMVSLPVCCYKNPAERPARNEVRMGKWVHFIICLNSLYSFMSREVSPGDNFRWLANDSFCSRRPELLLEMKNAQSCQL